MLLTTYQALELIDIFHSKNLFGLTLNIKNYFRSSQA